MIATMLACYFIQSAAVAQPPVTTDVRRKELRCGTYSLFVALKSIGIAPESIESLEALAGPPGQFGYSMLQLEQLARRLGAETIAVETSVEKLQSRPEAFACIALLNYDHFVLLYDIDDQSAYIVDPPNKLVVPVDTFKSEWTGKALLIGKTGFTPEEAVRLPLPWARIFLYGTGLVLVLAVLGSGYHAIRSRIGANSISKNHVMVIFGILSLSAPSGCGNQAGERPSVSRDGKSKPPMIRPEPPEHLLGDVLRTASKRTMDVTTKLHNRGGKPLEIGLIRTSCTCTSTALDKQVIPPGDSANLVSTIIIGDGPDATSSSLVVYSNDPDTPTTSIRFQWRAINPIRVKPSSCDFGKKYIGEPMAKRLEVYSSGLTFCKECRLIAKPVHDTISAQISPEASRFGGAIHRSEATGQDVKIGDLVVSLASDGDLGLNKHDILMMVVCDGSELARAAVPVTWRLSSGIGATPSRLSLGVCEPNQEVSRSIVIHDENNAGFSIVSVRSERGSIAHSMELPTPPSGLHEITIKFSLPGGEGVWRSVLTVETDSPLVKSVRIPVSAILKR